MIKQKTIRHIFSFILLFASSVAGADDVQYDAIFVWTSATTYDCYCFTEHPKIVCNGDRISVCVNNNEVKSFTIGDSAIKVTYGTYVAPSLNLVLCDDADNSAIISSNNAEFANQVTISGRSLWKDGRWNTLCLPFNVDKTGEFENSTMMILDTDGFYDNNIRYDNYMEGRKQTGFDSTSGTLYLYFREVDRIEAGMPCFVKWAEGVGSFTPVFTNVTIEDRLVSNTMSSDGKVTFLGTYSPLTFNEENKSVLFIGENNSLYYPSEISGNTINAFRAYYTLNGIEVGAESGMVHTYYLSLDNTGGVISDVKGVWVKVNETGSCYDLSGRKISGKPTVKGLYIVNGKKEIIR